MAYPYKTRVKRRLLANSPSPKQTPEAQRQEAGDAVLARLHCQYKTECEAQGYDVDGNRAKVQAALEASL